MTVTIYNNNNLLMPNVGGEVLDHIKKQIVSLLKKRKKNGMHSLFSDFSKRFSQTPL